MVKKYFIKGTKSEIKLGNEFITTIKTCDGKTYKSISTVDEGAIEDLIKRNSIDVIDVPVENKNKNINKNINKNTKENINKKNINKKKNKSIDDYNVEIIKCSNNSEIINILKKIFDNVN